MQTAYIVCMAVGVAVPLLTLLLGSLGDLFDGVFDGLSNALEGADIDLSIDLGEVRLDFLPLSMQSICAGVLLFGAVGNIVYSGENALAANIAGAAAGYVAAMLVQTLIGRLGRVRHEPLSREQLEFAEARVVGTIIAGGYGSISVDTGSGTTLGYPAKAEDGAEIPQGAAVYIVRFEKHTAVVKRARVPAGQPELKLYE